MLSWIRAPRFRTLLFLGVFLLFCTHSPAVDARVLSTPPGLSVLILYDDSNTHQSYQVLHQIFLINLLGHFNLHTTCLSMKNYHAQDVEHYDVIFYLGEKKTTLPPAFLEDVAQTQHPVIWFLYNIEQLIQNNPQYGLTYDATSIMSYDGVYYKNTLLTRYPAQSTNHPIVVTDPSIASIKAHAVETATGVRRPYVIHAQNLWYVADLPLTYLSENDRDLAFADLLFEMLGQNVQPQRRALIRLEDLDPTDSPELLKQIADYLYAEHVPFGLSLIPYYRDPRGEDHQGIPTFQSLTESPEFIDAIRYMQARGGTLILHGYTHQYDDINNGYTGISGHDYEFFKVRINPNTAQVTTFEPVDDDSVAWVSARVQAALALLHENGLSTSLWETPHYTASHLDNQYFAQTFAAILGRVLYFDPEKISQYAGQFFPYVIQHDVYGQKVIPENIGCISPVRWFNFPTRSVDEVVSLAQKNLVVRDAWASMYYHPYLGLSYLQELIPKIKQLGYTFVPISEDLI